MSLKAIKEYLKTKDKQVIDSGRRITSTHGDVGVFVDIGICQTYCAKDYREMLKIIKKYY